MQLLSKSDGLSSASIYILLYTKGEFLWEAVPGGHLNGSTVDDFMNSNINLCEWLQHIFTCYYRMADCCT